MGHAVERQTGANLPPSYNFVDIPVVTGREPLWSVDGPLPVVGGLQVDQRELLLTSVVDAVPEVWEPSPEPSIWPLLSALAVSALFIGSIFTPWAVVWGALPLAGG